MSMPRRIQNDALGTFMSWLCFGINRAAQNGSETSLKMLTLLRCVARQPLGDAVGFLCPKVHV
jgi:hypothetical protein